MVNFLDGKEIISTPEPEAEDIKDIFMAGVKNVLREIRSLDSYKTMKSEWERKPITYAGNPYPLWKNYQWLEVERGFAAALEFLNFNEETGASTVTYSTYKVNRKQIYVAGQKVQIAIDGYQEIAEKRNSSFPNAKDEIEKFYKNGYRNRKGDVYNFIKTYILAEGGGGRNQFGVDMYNTGDSQLDNDVEALDPKGRWNM